MVYQGSCHCGGISFAVEGDFTSGMDCNCSMCRRRGGLLAFVPRVALVLTTPEADMGTYRFNRHAIDHHFCPVCGIAPFGEGKAPDGAAVAAVNLRCLPDLDLERLAITKVDGRSF